MYRGKTSLKSHLFTSFLWPSLTKLLSLFGQVMLAELKSTDLFFAVKCLKKDVVLEEDDVDSTFIERKVMYFHLPLWSEMSGSSPTSMLERSQYQER